jgi:5'-nucleotidase
MPRETPWGAESKLSYEQMQVLLTNDDGIEALGLSLLAEVLRAHGTVHVVAPEEEQSGVGHRMTTRGELALIDKGDGRYALRGTPADCARVGLRGLGLRPDWLISGLNHGGNLGVDIHMSGTVAGAREGAILGCQAIAISQVISVRHPLDRARIRAITERVIASLLGRPLPVGQLYNVNLPFAPHSDEPEIVFCGPDPSPHDVRYTRGSDSFSYAGEFLQRERKPGYDVDCVLSGKVAVSVLSIV